MFNSKILCYPNKFVKTDAHFLWDIIDKTFDMLRVLPLLMKLSYECLEGDPLLEDEGGKDSPNRTYYIIS